MKKDIYKCDVEFLMFPPQAVLCRFDGVSEIPGALTPEDEATFKDLMKASGPFQLVVTRRLHTYKSGPILLPDVDGPPCPSCQFNAPELEIVLYTTREKVNLLNKLI